ncbi:hypothetical protein QAD02_014165 [Eretmocerus hayati]|uniref:Uncharacterized protein n=1 Tax=Eretmocerus hayati TaxID=131215 RepID=A0ACC2P5K1_9HYME|nr:hypothetical protein QAD02_014165 [Eretmocerus hayati]
MDADGRSSPFAHYAGTAVHPHSKIPVGAITTATSFGHAELRVPLHLVPNCRGKAEDIHTTKISQLEFQCLYAHSCILQTPYIPLPLQKRMRTTSSKPEKRPRQSANDSDSELYELCQLLEESGAYHLFSSIKRVEFNESLKNETLSDLCNEFEEKYMY